MSHGVCMLCNSEKCFVAPSVESSDAFFAKLTEDEAAKLQGIFSIFFSPSYKSSKMGSGEVGKWWCMKVDGTLLRKFDIQVEKNFSNLGKM